MEQIDDACRASAEGKQISVDLFIRVAICKRLGAKAYKDETSIGY